MKIFIGNLAADVTEDDLKQAVEAHTPVESVDLALDQDEQSKGFGFVEIADKEAGDKLIEALNGKELKGQALKVNEARPELPSRSGRERNVWNGIGGRNANRSSGKGKSKAKGGGAMGYGGGHVGSGEG